MRIIIVLFLLLVLSSCGTTYKIEQEIKNTQLRTYLWKTRTGVGDIIWSSHNDLTGKSTGEIKIIAIAKRNEAIEYIKLHKYLSEAIQVEEE